MSHRTVAPLLILFTFLTAPAFAGTYTGCVVQVLIHECTSDFGANVNIYIGTAQLFAPGGALLSTTTAMSLDVPASPNLAAQIAADPTMPAYVAANIGNFIGNPDMAELVSFELPTDTTGLAAFFTEVGITVDPVTIPTAPEDLLTTLTTQPVPFTVTSDTGYQLFGGGVPVYQYFIESPNIFVRSGSVDSPLIVGSGIGPFVVDGITYDFEGLTDVNIYVRDMQLTETATSPEPGTWLLSGAGLALALCSKRRLSAGKS